MITKENFNNLKIKSSDENYFMYPADGNGRLKPEYMFLQYKQLKPNTKYKILLNNSGGTELEDLTEFCNPYGLSKQHNTHRSNKIWRYFVSSPSGELFVKIRPFGTNSVDVVNKSWVNTWKYFNFYDKQVDYGRNDIKIIEYNQIVDPDSLTKFKTLLVDPQSISDAIFPSLNDSTLFTQKASPNYIQSFYIDPNSVGQAKTCDITDIVLYFRAKPNRKINRSGIDEPGVTVYLIDIVDGKPNVNRQYRSSIVSNTWNDITPSPDASIGITFSMLEPVRLATGKFYGICVNLDDDDYVLWSSKKGDALVITNEISPGSSKEHRGDLFGLTNIPAVNQSSVSTKLNDNIYNPIDDEDLKFDINVAEYELGDVTVNFVNDDYEFIILSDTTDNFWGGEYVYQVTTNATGTISIDAGSTTLTGIGTDFESLSEGDKIVLVDSVDSDLVEVVEVLFITSQTSLLITEASSVSISGNYQVAPIARVEYYDYYKKQLILNGSNAKTGKVFQAGGTIIGVESGESSTIDSLDSYPISVFRPDFNISLPSTFSLNAKYNYTYDNGGTYFTSNTSTFETDLNFLSPNYIRSYDALILSKSIEVLNNTNLYDNKKSAFMKLNLSLDATKSTVYESPTIDISYINTLNTTWLINNDITNEHTNYGNAKTKHISTKLIFEKDQTAEDIRVIYNAYRPINTDIKVYAKILNNNDPEPFDDKNWTELTMVSGNNEFGDLENVYDYREYEFGFPAFPPSNTTLAGVIETTQDSATVTGIGTTFTSLTAGDVIKIYSPLFPNENYGIFSIESVTNDTQLVLTDPVTNVNIVDTGLKIDTLLTPYTAFNNADNYNIVRYFGPTGESYDTYNTVAIKTVLLSVDNKIVPRVDDYRVIGVSA